MTGLILEFYDRSGWHEAPSPTRPVCVIRIDREAIHCNDAVSGYGSRSSRKVCHVAHSRLSKAFALRSFYMIRFSARSSTRAS